MPHTDLSRRFRRPNTMQSRISGTPRLKEWQLRLLYKKWKREYPFIKMHYCQGKLLGVTLIQDPAPTVWVRNEQEWESAKDILINAHLRSLV